MLLLVMEHEKMQRSPNWKGKRLAIALRRLTTTILARAARLRGVLVETVDGSPPSMRTVYRLSLPHATATTVMLRPKSISVGTCAVCGVDADFTWNRVGCISSGGKKGCNQATLIGAFGPPVTPTCSTGTALSTNGPCYEIDAVRVHTDGRDEPECANQSRLVTHLLPSRLYTP
ncbi:hypothetical protein Y032_0422g1181 [Ancylostoma ceylanicum]|uniref:Uncharacterized protein n=1 Tax=Ancylostoma ceylanicum TaxID=53326 RepID=A0A016X259_9BILA|nr:hypothetical protein Y032_0422g1181 [Ancylostoma ceylanicum]